MSTASGVDGDAPSRDARPRFQQLQYAFAAHLRDPDHRPAPDGLEDRRVAIYRDLFYANVENLLAGNFPVIRTLLDGDAWKALVRAFLAEHQSHTPLFTEIGREFVRFLQERAERDAGDAPFLPELAHYEWVELAVSIDETSLADAPHDPEGDVITGIPVPSPLAWPLAYRWPVQRIRADYRPDAPPDVPTCLIVLRRRDHQVAFIEASVATLQLLQVVKENPGLTGQQCIDAVLAALDGAQRAQVEPAARETLYGLRAREVLLGTRIA